MAMTLHIGKKHDVTVTTSDGSVLGTGAVSAVATPGLVASVTMNAATNVATITPLNPGSVTITFTATGYNPLNDSYVVAALPNLVVADGPEY